MVAAAPVNLAGVVGTTVVPLDGLFGVLETTGTTATAVVGTPGAAGAGVVMAFTGTGTRLVGAGQ
jgi:hypothetical protein